MKCSIPLTAFLLCCLSVANGGYDFVIEDGYFGAVTLDSSQSILVTGGGGARLALPAYTQATIRGTSPLLEGFGGIWEISLSAYSHLDFSGGEAGFLAINNYATGMLSGGRIDSIYSYQSAWKYAGDPPVLVPNPHITIVCDLDSVNHNTQTNILTGDWLDGTAFNIQLIDVSGYSPVLENIFFTPEPATLLLVGAGGILLRRKGYVTRQA